ncbi:hypothetical protein DYBT9275_05779 [Dyadobacter sp. CECT 9275]|uniref:Uncharacterized protein n=1 Tax=Dyadobacter helix TaxID=2822344 RepID=A0A916N8N8_9BACT|nr:hypothetical protein DYBT9275_05779 [Dyadobacter sp. CECT 9275]
MVEVFKTNVMNQRQAELILHQIHLFFSYHSVNFDLEDCDKILRIQTLRGTINASAVIGILNNSGFRAELLPDQIHINSGNMPGKYLLCNPA